ncbi:hypothetical protein LSH36_156g05025 [Paralvinella palmiformis]|uniref:RING-type domain-containing protein n=1 Tax=Paralvinella palmiformis TaxID=53620 RepID=A0AAD9JVH2_9ANNE|nr:hypothetical protein LSH36_156g05025 [Paralvinella palmiformis]
MPPIEIPMCDVCDVSRATAGGLSCGHRFCPDCFKRYISGSIRELDTSLRCCVCGAISDLIQEMGEGRPLVTFGRLTERKLLQPMGLARVDNGDYVIVDSDTKRVMILTGSGTLREDFAYTYGTEPGGGVSVTAQGHVAIPNRDNTYDGVGYYTPGGAFIGSAFIQSEERRPDIRGVVCDKVKDVLYLTDANNSSIIAINNADRGQCNRIRLERIRYEVDPIPWGITLSPEGDLYVTDVANHCVKVYSTCGQFRRKFGSYGERPSQYKRPTGVSLTAAGHVIVADRGNQRVQHVTNDGAFLSYVVRFRAGYDVYMAPDDVIASPDGTISVLMTSLQHTKVGGVRVYKL